MHIHIYIRISKRYICKCIWIYTNVHVLKDKTINWNILIIFILFFKLVENPKKKTKNNSKTKYKIKRNKIIELKINIYVHIYKMIYTCIIYYR